MLFGYFMLLFVYFIIIRFGYRIIFILLYIRMNFRINEGNHVTIDPAKGSRI